MNSGTHGHLTPEQYKEARQTLHMDPTPAVEQGHQDGDQEDQNDQA